MSSPSAQTDPEVACRIIFEIFKSDLPGHLKDIMAQWAAPQTFSNGTYTLPAHPLQLEVPDEENGYHYARTPDEFEIEPAFPAVYAHPLRDDARVEYEQSGVSARTISIALRILTKAVTLDDAETLVSRYADAVKRMLIPKDTLWGAFTIVRLESSTFAITSNPLCKGIQFTLSVEAFSQWA